jgi:hypothetical protein
MTIEERIQTAIDVLIAEDAEGPRTILEQTHHVFGDIADETVAGLGLYASDVLSGTIAQALQRTDSEGATVTGAFSVFLAGVEFGKRLGIEDGAMLAALAS